MSSLRSTPGRFFIAFLPAIFVCLLGAAWSFSQMAEGQALAIGGAIALPLIAAGVVIARLCAGSRGGLAVLAVIAPFVIRIAGAAIVLGFTMNLPNAVYLVGGLVGALAISVLVDLVAAVTATLREPVRV